VSVTLENVRLTGVAGRGGPLFDGLSLHIGDNSRVGILGTKTSGTGTLLRLICGTEAPEDGIIRREGRISWPIPLTSFIMNTHTLARNVRFIARLYGIDDENFPRRIAEMAELTEFLNTPLSKCPKLVRPRLAYALGIGMDFDLYLFNASFAPADKPFKERAEEISGERTAGRGIVVATSVPAEVEKNCESVYVLEEGRAIYFADTGEGIEHFKQLLATEKKKEKPGAGRSAEDEDEDEGLGDVDIIGAAVGGAVE